MAAWPGEPSVGLSAGVRSGVDDSIWVLALACWLAAQVGALALAEAGVVLSAGWPSPGARAALTLAVTVQAGVGVVLAPVLLGRADRLATVLLAGLAMTALAGRGAGVSAAESLGAWAYAAAWLTAADAWARVPRSPAGRSTLAAAAGGLVFGAAGLAYLANEFGTSGLSEGLSAFLLHLSPLTSAWNAASLLHFPPLALWLAPVAFFASGAGFVAWQARSIQSA